MAATATSDRLLKAGAILQADAAHGADVPCDRLDARTYAHPALPGAPVVLLSPPALAPGDDQVMSYLGFAEPAVQPAVGLALRHALGFPAWALVNDPKHARHALDVVKAMKAAGRRVRSKPGHAWDAYDAIARQLGRSTAHFLPSYWEEVGRAFIDAGNSSYAGRAFGKAREAEKIHALTVDLALLRDCILEFALRGAVSIKSLDEFAAQVARRQGATEAWIVFRELCVKRCQGGMPPWAGMIDGLTALARSAKRDVAAELRQLMCDLMPLPSTRRAPVGFWTAAKPALDELAGDPAWAGRLLDCVPLPSGGGGGCDWYGTWVGWLDAWGLLRHVEAGALPDGTPFAAGAWFQRMIGHLQGGWRSDGLPDLAYELQRRLAPRMRAEGAALQLASEYGHIDLDLLHAALELRLPLADPPQNLRFNLRGWAQSTEGSSSDRRRDPVLVLADARFAPALHHAVAHSMDEAGFLNAVVRHPRLLESVRQWLEGRFAEASASGLPDAIDLASTLASCLTPAMRTALPGVVVQAGGFSVAPSLARTLRAGIMDEFGWPALEAAVGRLRREPDPTRDDDGRPTISGQAPFAVVCNGVRAEVVGASGTVLEADLELPAGTRPDAVLYRDGHLAVHWSVGWDERWIAWSHRPKEHHPTKERIHAGLDGLQIELAGGGTCAGHRCVRAGDPQPQLAIRHVLGDGRNLWIFERGVEPTLRELDPATGDVGRSSLPAFFEAGLGDGRTLRLDGCHLWPLGSLPEGAPLAAVDGVVGLRSLQLADGSVLSEGLDGRSWRGTACMPDALATWPGDDAVRIIDVGYPASAVRTADGRRASLISREWAPGQDAVLPLTFWTMLRPRDPAASAVLRRIDEALAAELIRVAGPELPADAGDADDDDDDDDTGPAGEAGEAMPDTRRLVAERIGAVEPRMLSGLLAVIAIAARTAQRFAALAEAEQEQAADDATEAQAATGCELVGWGLPGVRRLQPVTALVRFASALRAGADGGKRVSCLVPWWTAPESLLDACFGVLLSGGARKRYGQVVEAPRAAVAALLEGWAGSGLAELPGGWRRGSCSIDRKQLPAGFALNKAGYSFLEGGGWSGGNAFLVRMNTWSADQAEVCEYAPDGVFHGLPGTAAFRDTVDVTLPDPARCRAWAAALGRAEPPPPPTADLADRAAAAMGCDRATAALILGGFPGLDSYEHNFLPKEDRERMGVKLSDASAARQRLRDLKDGQRRALAAALAGADPAGLWSPDQPDASGTSPLQRLAAAWRSFSDAPCELPAVTRHRPSRALIRACAEAMAGREPFAPPAGPSLSENRWKHPELDLGEGGDDEDEGAGRMNQMLLHLVQWAAREVHLLQPIGSPSAAAVTALLPAIDRAIADPACVFHLGILHQSDASLWKRQEQIWDADMRTLPVRQLAHGQHRAEVKDDGLLAIGRVGETALLAFHPAAIRSDADAARIAALRPGERDQVYRFGLGGFDAVMTWRSRSFRQLLACIAAPAASPDAYAADPRVSAPAVVSAARKRLRLDEDAATAYLQILALAEAGDAQLRRWNGWDGERLETALQTLVQARLLMEAKRKGAGRTRFLPGGWEELKDPYMPVESWKLEMYGAVRRKSGLQLPQGPLFPIEPLGSMFARAWARIESGDAPRYEEVR